jgi:hypothetical protein
VQGATSRCRQHASGASPCKAQRWAVAIGRGPPRRLPAPGQSYASIWPGRLHLGQHHGGQQMPPACPCRSCCHSAGLGCSPARRDAWHRAGPGSRTAARAIGRAAALRSGGIASSRSTTSASAPRSVALASRWSEVAGRNSRERACRQVGSSNCIRRPLAARRLAHCSWAVAPSSRPAVASVCWPTIAAPHASDAARRSLQPRGVTGVHHRRRCSRRRSPRRT